MIITPCKDCKDRKERCHSTCEAYIVWKQSWNNERDQIIKMKNIEKRLNERRNDAIKRMFYSK